MIMNDEDLKEAPYPGLMYYPGILMELLRKATKSRGLGSW
jgi:hypothetical protein